MAIRTATLTFYRRRVHRSLADGSDRRVRYGAAIRTCYANAISQVKTNETYEGIVMSEPDPAKFNRTAWDNIARSGRWFDPVDSTTIDSARTGDWSLRLTATKPIPKTWLGDVTNKRILCLAGGGGHQGPVLAAAGACVTVLDFSEEQLAIDRRVADEHGLELETVAGDMRDLSIFDDGRFDLVVNPCSVNFCPDVRPVWIEAARVLRCGGELLAGLIQPVNYLFDARRLAAGDFVVRHRIPYSDVDLPQDERDRTIGTQRPIEFGHTLTDLIAGQLAAGLVLTDLFEDRWGGKDLLSDFIPIFLATRASKPVH